jgi:hypothetical protein
MVVLPLLLGLRLQPQQQGLLWQAQQHWLVNACEPCSC